ncbi:MAG: hypothetical protein ACYTEK_25960 [Planctomycetota bacterium]|jgi:FtsH-binding integral membrane protein
MKRYPVIKKLNRGDRPMYAGLLAFSLSALAIVTGIEEFDTAIHVGIICIAASIPSLAFCTERIRIDSQYKYRTHSVGIDLAEGVGIFGSLIGFSAIIWHFSVVAALVFIGVAFGVISLEVWYEDAMAKLNEEAEQET